MRMRARPFAVMVLDLMMPVMTGPELIEYIETHDDAGARCIIVVSAASERDVGRIKSAHVHAVLRKPFDLHELVAAVQACEGGHEERPRQE
jgi:CheY-like chemotaxis protein